MPEKKNYIEPLVYGLDIGTRSIVGTVGYKTKDKFNVIAQCVKYHDTRAMLDGQIHDIQKVASSIKYVTAQLEKKIGKALNEVCIAAAGRVLKTSTARGDVELEEGTVVDDEMIYSLDLIGVENAHNKLREEAGVDINFYCVAYTVVRYYLNDYAISNLQGHKANKISAEVLATFLPDEVIDGLYRAVKMAGLEVANLTLEPIAAMNVAIPEKYRLLNIALVDVGAGTSDICITKDGTIVAYGMIPFAGDEITEVIVQHYLVDFDTAENIKMIGAKKKSVVYKDIMGLSQKVSPTEVYKVVEPTVNHITKKIAEKIKELNGGKSVSAVFVVGGGGKIPSFVNDLAKHLGLAKERVALRGEEVLGDVTILQADIKKDPLLVTPIGICLNYYDQKNNFIFVNVNGERVKLYNNDHLTVVDAAMQIGYPNELLFPRRGKDINFTLNGKEKIVRGYQGEPAIITVNNKEANISTTIIQNDIIVIKDSTIGEPAHYEIGQIPEFAKTITFEVNEQKIICPKFALVNGELKSEFYSIQNNDIVEILNYYTVEQLLKFMDLNISDEIYVNNRKARKDEKIYENFSISWGNNVVLDYGIGNDENKQEDELQENELEEYDENIEDFIDEENENIKSDNDKKDIKQKEDVELISINVVVNNKPVTLSGKSSYVFVNIFDFYNFDLTQMRGSQLIVTLNNEQTDYMRELKDGDIIEIYWKE